MKTHHGSPCNTTPPLNLKQAAVHGGYFRLTCVLYFTTFFHSGYEAKKYTDNCSYREKRETVRQPSQPSTTAPCAAE